MLAKKRRLLTSLLKVTLMMNSLQLKLKRRSRHSSKIMEKKLEFQRILSMKPLDGDSIEMTVRIEDMFLTGILRIMKTLKTSLSSPQNQKRRK